VSTASDQVVEVEVIDLLSRHPERRRARGGDGRIGRLVRRLGQRSRMTPERVPYTQERGGSVERVLGIVDGIRGLLGGILVLVIAVASFSAGGTSGWALGGCLLGLLGVGALLVVLRRQS
jgi:hypothetical protein